MIDFLLVAESRSHRLYVRLSDRQAAIDQADHLKRRGFLVSWIELTEPR